MTFYGNPRLMPESKMRSYSMPAPSIPRCESDHFQEWVAVCKGGRVLAVECLEQVVQFGMSPAERPAQFGPMSSTPRLPVQETCRWPSRGV